MPLRNILAIALLLLFGPLSLAGKLALPSAPEQVAATTTTPGTDAVLQAGELVRVTSRPLIDGAAYSLAIYRYHVPERCSGLLYLMPMTTNAEASALLANADPERVIDHFFVLGGKLTDRYPAWRHWLLRTSAQLEHLLGRPVATPVVHGVATTSPCLGARQLDWSRLRI